MRSGRGSRSLARGAQMGDERKEEEVECLPTAVVDVVNNGRGTSYFALKLCAGLYKLLLLWWWCAGSKGDLSDSSERDSGRRSGGSNSLRSRRRGGGVSGGGRLPESEWEGEISGS